MKKLRLFAVCAALLALTGYGLWNRRVLIPRSNLYIHIPPDTKPRLWGNAVEFDHLWWATICYQADGHVKCDKLKKASPR
jgi:hypothetical protein